MSDGASPTSDDDSTTARQLLHWATGDREAEAEALADAAGPEVDKDDAEEAVKRAHGDLGVDEKDASDSDVAHPADARAVARESD